MSRITARELAAEHGDALIGRRARADLGCIGFVEGIIISVIPESAYWVLVIKDGWREQKIRPLEFVELLPEEDRFNVAL